MVRIVRDKFTIERDASITFETSTLDICKGLSVEIDESAYEAVSTFLDEIIVVTGPGKETYWVCFERHDYSILF